MSALQKQIFEMLMESQYSPPNQMLAFQRSQLSQLLHHARAYVPFYKKRLDPIFRSNGEIDWDRWNKIPITTRAELRDLGHEMIATRLPSGHGKLSRNFTSGSSGIPVMLKKNGLFIETTRAISWRSQRWAELDWSKASAEFPPRFNQARANEEGFYCGLRGPSWLETSRGAKITINRQEKEAAILALLRRFDVQFISSNPNLIGIIAHENLALNDPVQIEKIICYGMHTPDQQRILFRRSFGAETYSIYSAEEVGQIAAQCQMQNAYHINAEHMLVEIIDDHGQPCPNGVAGRVIITSFFSTSQPLIRYNIGDIAELGQPCPCGKSLPTISRIVGRQDPIFRLPNGKGFWPAFNHEAIATSLQCKSYQIAQIEALTFEVRYVRHMLGASRNLDLAREHISHALAPTATIIFKEVESIPMGGGLKLQRLVREIR